MSLVTDKDVKVSSLTFLDAMILNGELFFSVSNDKSGVVLVSFLQGEMSSVQLRFVLEENTQCLSMKYGQF